MRRIYSAHLPLLLLSDPFRLAGGNLDEERLGLLFLGIENDVIGLGLKALSHCVSWRRKPSHTLAAAIYDPHLLLIRVLDRVDKVVECIAHLRRCNRS